MSLDSCGYNDGVVPLLPAKFYFPPARACLVARSRLIERLQAGLSNPLTLVSAPAGSGKTTILSQWHLGPGLDISAAWLSLDPSDNDLARFLRYLRAALDELMPGLKEEPLPSLESEGETNWEAIMTSMIGRLSGLDTPSVLVLDDYHLVENPVIHRVLTFLLDHLPRHLHLILLTRADPPLPLSRLRARGQLTEIRAADLRFSVEECAQFMNQVMDLGLSGEQVAALEKRTEGWIAGLQLAALSMHGRDDLDGFITAFSGSHHFIVDYLMEEVLQRQPEELRQFLLKTSILERLTGPLCNALTGQDNGGEILRRLDHANLFIIPLDDEQRWYRYHHLFRDLLFRQLEQNQPKQIYLLHCRAAEWYEKEELMAEAVHHAMLGEDTERLIRLIQVNAYAIDPTILLRLASKLESIPDDKKLEQPWIFIAQAWAQVQSSRLDDATCSLHKAQDVLDRFSSLSDIEGRRLRGHIAAINGYRLCLEHDFFRAVESLRGAMDILPKEDIITRSHAATVLGSIYRWIGPMSEASKYAEEAVSLGHLTRNINVLIDVLGDQAIIKIRQGKLNQAAEICQQAIQIAKAQGNQRGSDIPVLGPVYSIYSSILREWNALEISNGYAQKGLRLCQLWGNSPNIFRSYYDLAKILYVTEHHEEAELAIQEAEKVARNLSQWYVDRASDLRLWQQLLSGNSPTAALWAQASGVIDGDQFQIEFIERYCLIAKILLANGNYEHAKTFLDKLQEMAEEAGTMGIMVELLAMQALTLARVPDQASKKDKMETSMLYLQRSFGLAMSEGYVRTFVELGVPMFDLLSQARARNIEPAYVNKLLNEFGKETNSARLASAMSSNGQNTSLALLFEAISGREMEVLKLLAQGYSNKLIAETLVISPGTVHKHLKNIYAKLNVHNRTEAVAHARELNLL